VGTADLALPLKSFQTGLLPRSYRVCEWGRPVVWRGLDTPDGRASAGWRLRSIQPCLRLLWNRRVPAKPYAAAHCLLCGGCRCKRRKPWSSSMAGFPATISNSSLRKQLCRRLTAENCTIRLPSCVSLPYSKFERPSSVSFLVSFAVFYPQKRRNDVRRGRISPAPMPLHLP
jgi:hypothetical protein